MYNSKFSYWEQNTFFSNIDLVIIGSGIVGLTSAITYKEKHPNHKVLILERGILPNGASSKNAGFACFGSPSELLDDLQNSSEDEVFSLVEKRWEGLKLLRQSLDDDNIVFQANSGYEIFTSNQKKSYDECLEKLSYLNNNLASIIGKNVYSKHYNNFGFNNIIGCIKNQYEGQIDTGKMINTLINKAKLLDITIINNTTVTKIEDNDLEVCLSTSSIGNIKSKKVIVATNGFAHKLIKIDVTPARAQVIITKPIKNLSIKGTFHLEKGYFYFRNIHDRILLGGGRNLNFKAEETTNIKTTPEITNHLEKLLKNIILPSYEFEIDYSWAGIMGVGKTKETIIKRYSNNVICAVKLGGMGVAIGYLVGKKAINLLD